VITRSAVWTNVAFVPAILIAGLKGIFAPFFLYTLLATASYYYHLSGEKEWGLQDRVLAWSAMTWNGVAFVRSIVTPEGNSVAAMLGALFAALAIVVYLKVPSKDAEYFRRPIMGANNYDGVHSAWHMLSGCAAAFFVASW
jgi:hypothetical protein